MTEWEKAQKGYLYDANYDKEIIEARTRCADLCYEFNNLRPSDTEKQQELLKLSLIHISGIRRPESRSEPEDRIEWKHRSKHRTSCTF